MPRATAERASAKGQLPSGWTARKPAEARMPRFVFIDRKRWRQLISRHLQPLREITLRHSGGVELL
jgi:hypothetical protein